MRKWPKIFSYGDVFVRGIKDGPISITEKIDGSQFNFGLEGGACVMASKGADIDIESPPKIFAPSVEHVLSVSSCLKEGWTYHGEALFREKHNTLTYGRVPTGNIVLFGAVNEQGEHLEHEAIAEVAKSLGVDVAPELWSGMGHDLGDVVVKSEELLETISFLGLERIEGFVIKNYARALEYHGLAYPLTQAKFVSQRFKERHAKNTSFASPTEKLAAMVRNDARWDKAVQSLRDDGQLTQTVKDIGPLLKKLNADIDDEDVEFFKEKLWDIYGRQIKKMACNGFPEWYKNKLLQDTEGAST